MKQENDCTLSVCGWHTKHIVPCHPSRPGRVDSKWGASVSDVRKELVSLEGRKLVKRNREDEGAAQKCIHRCICTRWREGVTYWTGEGRERLVRLKGEQYWGFYGMDNCKWGMLAYEQSASSIIYHFIAISALKNTVPVNNKMRLQ